MELERDFDAENCGGHALRHKKASLNNKQVAAPEERDSDVEGCCGRLLRHKKASNNEQQVIAPEEGKSNCRSSRKVCHKSSLQSDIEQCSPGLSKSEALSLSAPPLHPPSSDLVAVLRRLSYRPKQHDESLLCTTDVENAAALKLSPIVDVQEHVYTEVVLVRQPEAIMVQNGSDLVIDADKGCEGCGMLRGTDSVAASSEVLASGSAIDSRVGNG